MAGRPKRVFTEEQKEEAQSLAFNGCQNNTIATLMDIPINTLIRHFGKLLTKKRAERKDALRSAQTRKAIITRDTAMLCFLGKNELGQKDSKDLNIGGSVSITLKRKNSK